MEDQLNFGKLNQFWANFPRDISYQLVAIRVAMKFSYIEHKSRNISSYNLSVSPRATASFIVLAMAFFRNVLSIIASMISL